VRNLCARYGVWTRVIPHAQRARHRGRHQQAVASACNKPFIKVIDQILFARAGIEDLLGLPILPRDPLRMVDLLSTFIYGPHPWMASQRRQLRQTLLRALAERSQILTQTFHKDPRFPTSLLRVSD